MSRSRIYGEIEISVNSFMFEFSVSILWGPLLTSGTESMQSRQGCSRSYLVNIGFQVEI